MMEMDTDTPVPSATTTASVPTSAPASAPPSVSASSPSTPAEPRRRNRPALSCIQCRTRKIRCDRMEPCGSCLKSKIVNCMYEEARRPKPRMWRLSPAQDPDSPASDDHFPRYSSSSGLHHLARPDTLPSSNAAGMQYAHSAASLPILGSSRPASTATPAPSSAAPAAPAVNAEHLRDRIRVLEKQLDDVLWGPDQGQAHQPSASHPVQTYSAPDPAPAPAPKPTQPEVGHKPRPKFFPLLSHLAQRIMGEKGSKACFLFDMCKKAVRTKRLQSQQSLDRSSHEAGRDMPPENTARLLVEAYFRTFESVYRILHRPTFWQEYRRYWEGSSTNEAFAIELKLCMTLGSCFHNDMVPHRQSLAGKWIYEARVWLISPDDKTRTGIETIQIMCLLHLARETSGVGGDLAWVSAGSLLREAMHIGLHRDPDGMPNMTTLHSEMRRRLWATTMEIILQSSIDSGGPPLVALTDFDTRPPSNYDDDQLTETDNPPPAPRPLSAFTQSTVQIALTRSLPTRLGIAQYVNHFRTPSSSFSESLRWSTELSTACRALSATLQPHYDPAGVLPKRLTAFQLRLAEQMVHRFFLVLTFPWLAQDNPAYFYARKLCVETSLKLSRAAVTAGGDDFSRLATCAHGAFRSVPAFALLAICLELLWQVQEDQSFRESMELDHAPPPPPPSEGDAGSGAAPRQELVEAVRGSIAWSEQRIKAGDTNIKGRLFYAALLAQVNALERGGAEAEVEGQVLASVVEDLEHCWLLLKGPGTAGTSSPVGEVAGEEREGEWGEEQNSGHGFKSIFNHNEVEMFLCG
ncbi:hypothetical protein B0T18DRAFT_429767 [Schizothecium vesticola]|uniref:Zn(2)-C6 fungal-type domain-containing protein n=1 Tax=Schizothecium vesticola TaxID=314040 RepID=A0AA40EWN3_9PEZI|nr:hypothetical protein B0T18DRAFT_429767 [Schizothecium vesticola]